jgi:hypothetical protein
MIGAAVDDDAGLSTRTWHSLWPARLRIDVKMRKIAGGDVEPQTVARPDQRGCRIGLNGRSNRLIRWQL